MDRRDANLLAARLWQLYQEVEKTEDIAILEESFDKTRPEWELYLKIMALVDTEREELLSKLLRFLQGNASPSFNESALSRQ